MLRHGLGYERNPILKPLDNIREQDALLDLSDPDHPKGAVWPDADFIDEGNDGFAAGPPAPRAGRSGSRSGSRRRAERKWPRPHGRFAPAGA